MKTPARAFGHPIHQTLVVFPMGLLVTSLGFDVVHLATGMLTMAYVAHWTLAAGLVGALIAIPFGVIDWISIPAGTRAKRVGALHGGGNAVVTVLFLVSWWARTVDQPPSALAVGASALATALLLVTAWLGGELVSRLTVGVHDDAHLDAPSARREHGGTVPARTRAHDDVQASARP